MILIRIIATIFIIFTISLGIYAYTIIAEGIKDQGRVIRRQYVIIDSLQAELRTRQWMDSVRIHRKTSKYNQKYLDKELNYMGLK